MKNDIETVKEIELLVKTFYDKVKLDPAIGYIFNDLVKVNWDKHLPVMVRFWENVIFYTGTYTGNPMMVHKHLDKLFPLTAEHFAVWNNLFLNTVDELFEGKKAILAKQRAVSISTVMQLEILKMK
ncbi:MAG: group III truncated hemoglobin [Ferruginibacter sp.]